MNRRLNATRSRRAALTASVALVAGQAFSTRAHASILYVTGNTSTTILEFPNAGYSGSVTAASSSNNYVTLSHAVDVASDTSGNIVAVTYNGTSGGAYAFSPSGTTIGTSSAFGNENYHEALYNNTLYATSNVASASQIVSIPYNAGSFGSPTTLATNTPSYQTGEGLALAPANGPLSNTATYLFYSSASGTTSTINALNLSNNNAVALNTAFSLTAVVDALAYDPKNGDLYGCSDIGGGLAIFAFMPIYSNGTLVSISDTSITTTSGAGSPSLIAATPDGLAFGPDGNLYIAEHQSEEIDEVNIDGNGTGTQDAVNKYVTLSFAPNGLLFVPEPASTSLLTLGAATLALRRRRARS